MKSLITLLSALPLSAAGLDAAEAPARPNIVIVIADDQGYPELSCHGNPIVRTPHLDKLRAESIRFTDFHVAPMCTPTRGQLLTGVDALRNGAMNVSSGRTLLRREYPTLADLLKPAGYATGQFGKWHLGDNYPYRPIDRGFDEAVWFPSSHIGAVPDFWQNDYFDDTYVHNGARKKYSGYTTTVFFDEAKRWMAEQRRAGRPFFTYLATAAPHGPLYVPEEYRRRVLPRAALADRPPLDRQTLASLTSYLAMIEHFDDEMGKLETFFADEKLRDNTIVVYLTDNGSTFGPRYFNAGMRGGKVTLWEGGHRVPLFVRWPAAPLGTPRDVTALAQVQDLAPTLLELAGVQSPSNAAFDGRSLVPLMHPAGGAWPDRMLFINYSRMPVSPLPDGGNAAILRRAGAAVLWRRWRLLEDRELYDLATDPAQERDVAAEHPEVVAKMRAELAKWWAGVEPRVNEPSRITIGGDAENPQTLTACEWFDVFIDQQAQVRRGERKNGAWHLHVDRAGEYEFTLRRWPREADLPLAAAAPEAKLTDGRLPPGTALPIARAKVEIAGQAETREVSAEAREATFTVRLEGGPAELRTTFLTADDAEICGAYYVDVRRK